MKEAKLSKTLVVLMIICVCLSLATLAIVVYDRFIKKEPEHAVLKPLEIPTVEEKDDTQENDEIAVEQE